MAEPPDPNGSLSSSPLPSNRSQPPPEYDEVVRQGEQNRNIYDVDVESEYGEGDTPVFDNPNGGEKNPKATPPARKHRRPSSSPEEPPQIKRFAFGTRDCQMGTQEISNNFQFQGVGMEGPQNCQSEVTQPLDQNNSIFLTGEGERQEWNNWGLCIEGQIAQLHEIISTLGQQTASAEMIAESIKSETQNRVDRMIKDFEAHYILQARAFFSNQEKVAESQGEKAGLARAAESVAEVAQSAAIAAVKETEAQGYEQTERIRAMGESERSKLFEGSKQMIAWWENERNRLLQWGNEIQSQLHHFVKGELATHKNKMVEEMKSELERFRLGLDSKWEKRLTEHNKWIRDMIKNIEHSKSGTPPLVHENSIEVAKISKRLVELEKVVEAQALERSLPDMAIKKAIAEALPSYQGPAHHCEGQGAKEEIKRLYVALGPKFDEVKFQNSDLL